jgi:hypothetical protein
MKANCFLFLIFFLLLSACKYQKEKHEKYDCICIAGQTGIQMCLKIKNDTVYYSNIDTCFKVISVSDGEELKKREYFPKIIPLIHLKSKDTSYSNAVRILSPQVVSCPKIIKLAYIENKFYSNTDKDTIYRIFIKNIYDGYEQFIGVNICKNKGVLGYYEIEKSKDKRYIIYTKFAQGNGFFEKIDTNVYKIDNNQNLRKL